LIPGDPVIVDQGNADGHYLRPRDQSHAVSENSSRR
jgi:hypothetical protein